MELKRSVCHCYQSSQDERSQRNTLSYLPDSTPCIASQNSVFIWTTTGDTPIIAQQLFWWSCHFILSRVYSIDEKPAVDCNHSTVTCFLNGEGRTHLSNRSITIYYNLSPLQGKDLRLVQSSCQASPWESLDRVHSPCKWTLSFVSFPYIWNF